MEAKIKARLVVSPKRETTTLDRAKAFDEWMRTKVKSNFYAQNERMFNSSQIII